ncbi:ABC transporter ATP-binding protein [Bacillus sp. AGMB 02131]|uniref:ABC transporter ATP-binding protein n=1 Tax=Peribacillus faecalis TaxID=2772559 RepID=A0A927CZC8_9BACI|nr:ABC transporter ATP-binding protein [Peribacillus faecalis]MBD3108715.1 ABC transporter ATP-binding protein [Peribacillus faecalis]
MTAILQMRDLTFKRGNRIIVDHMNLSIEAGQFIGLIGPNGTGKSTLLRLLAKLLKPYAGSVHFGQKNLNEMTDIEVAKAITYMPQTTILDYQFTVEQVVMMGRHPHRKKWQLSHKHDSKIVEDSMKQTGIDHLKDRFITTLSGGERQLVFLAKAITQQSEVILLDEPTSDLDIYHQVQISEIICRLAQDGKTVLAAIHDINLAARYCDQLLLLRDGDIAAFAAPTEALTEEFLQKVFQTKSYTYDDPFLDKRQVIPYSVSN